MSGSTKKDIFGQRFGDLVAVRYSGVEGRRAMWQCVCKCGREKTVDGVRLRNGSVKSCGCLKNKGSRLRHGHSKKLGRTRTYNSWHHMRDRCLNPASAKWESYGGRGISICERWMGFENFLADMGDCPHGLTIDRIDVNGNYEPGNCRWATPLDQSRNVRRNVYLTYQGETRPIWEWAETVGIDSRTLNMRRLRGWSDADIISVPLGGKRKPA